MTCIIFENDWSESQQDTLAFGGKGECGLDLMPVFELPAQASPGIFISCHGDVFWPTGNRFVLQYGYSLRKAGFCCSGEKIITGIGKGHGCIVACNRYRLPTPPAQD